MVSHNAPEQGIGPLEVERAFDQGIGAAACDIKFPTEDGKTRVAEMLPFYCPS